MISCPTSQPATLARPPFSAASARDMAIVAHWCCACHQMSGMVKATASTDPARNHRFSTSRRPSARNTPMTSATANKPTLCLLASPSPSTTPASGHQRTSPVRPIFATTSARAAQASMSKAVGPNR